MIRLYLKISLLFSVMVFFSVAIASPVKILDVRVSHQKNKSRFVFDATQPISYKHFFLTHPDRLVIDIPRAMTRGKLKAKNLKQTPVKKIRSYKHKQRYLRIVFDLKRKVMASFFILSPKNGHYYRLVIDLFRKKSKIVKKPMLTAAAAKPHQLRDIVVVIDPGHGGRDPGAMGVGRHREKTVVLAIAKDLQKMLNREKGFKARLTRRGNYFVSLWERLRIARHDKADMFIAIHADAYPNRRAHGASVYALSERGATSTAARWLAQRENRSELMGGVDLSDKDNTLRSVLISLSQNHTISVSLKIGSAILRQLSQFAHLHYHKVEQAAFVVLKSPDIPSLLVETGFISSPREERRLLNQGYQKRIAYALMLGIKDYYLHHPPPDSYLSAHANSINTL